MHHVPGNFLRENLKYQKSLRLLKEIPVFLVCVNLQKQQQII